MALCRAACAFCTHLLPGPDGFAIFLWSRNSEWRRITRVIRRLAAAALAFAAVAAPSAHAAPTCKNIAVTALAFGNYDVYNAVPADSAGTTGGTDWLSYDIFVDAARNTVWSSIPVSLPAGNAVSVPYYARAFALQDVSVGNYSDTLIVTFNF
ncbi:MAG: spore coat protein U domain-containing protein [Deltaproteobacteria bacterium]|nr:MAG: spore coat protein U domain-containing protein [Deltaproteobacteria bacterium]